MFLLVKKLLCCLCWHHPPIGRVGFHETPFHIMYQFHAWYSTTDRISRRGISYYIEDTREHSFLTSIQGSCIPHKNNNTLVVGNWDPWYFHNEVEFQKIRLRSNFERFGWWQLFDVVTRTCLTKLMDWINRLVPNQVWMRQWGNLSFLNLSWRSPGSFGWRRDLNYLIFIRHSQTDKNIQNERLQKLAMRNCAYKSSPFFVSLSLSNPILNNDLF